MELAVSFGLECAHYAPLPPHALHGHSYVVRVWFTGGGDLDCAACAIKSIGKLIDHTELGASIGGSRMEDIAAWLMPRMCLLAGIEVTRIQVERPTLGYAVELRR